MTRMHPRPIFLTTLVLALAILATACSSSDAETADGHAGSPRDAELSPDFAVPTSEGGTFSLDEHLATDGRPVFLNLWASWCFPCREEMPAIDTASKEHPEVAFIGVSIRDSRSEAEAFIEEIGVTYLIGFDDDDALDRDYQPLGLPASYIISSEGVVLERIFGVVTEEDLSEKFAEHFG
jgi:cytochrome c biogenesis protein CcmG/thiol:disulfide interchange protein DsbE